ncbi:MAG: GIY-YIG nuclease family protein [Candidatus Helarchaeota archaeon]|nr:GIY-YIG nuclease family protein [Candidatus Helarchaeota archaeon]
MFEKIKRQLRDALIYSEKLVKAENHDPKNIDLNTVPKKIGVYLWRSNRNNKIVYVGRALGRRGLYQRIMRQHLSDNYTKSVFRKQIAEEYGLNLRDESTSFIKDNFVFSFISFEGKDKNIVSLVETLLIYEYLPKYNQTGK